MSSSVFEVVDRNKARAFVQVPAAEAAGRASGVIDGEYRFVEDRTGYCFRRVTFPILTLAAKLP